MLKILITYCWDKSGKEKKSRNSLSKSTYSIEFFWVKNWNNRDSFYLTASKINYYV